MTIGVDDIDQDILKTYLDQYNDDPTSFSWQKVFDAIKSMGGAAAKFATSGPGIAGLGGAALGLLDKAKPTGGGTTMAYPGAMDLSRTMVQGKYGPIAEYKSPYFTGTADYRDFKSPTFPGLVGGQAPAAAPAAPGRSVASKIAQYKELAGYGLSDERIRRIAEVMYGPQTDSDWAELTRLAGDAAKGIKTELKGTLPYEPGIREHSDEDISAAVTVYGPDGTIYSSPAAARRAGVTNYTSTPPSKTAPTPTPAPAPVFQVTQGSTPQAKANEYNRLRANMSDAEVRALADTVFGKQTDADWSYLKQLAGAGAITGQAGAEQGIASLAQEDPFIKSLREAIGGSLTTSDVDPSLYATYGPMMAPGTPQKLVYSQEDEGLVYQPSVRGQDLSGVDFSGKTFGEVENTLKRFKDTPPKTQEELTLANSAWNEYQNRFSSGTTKQFGNVTKNVDQFGNETGSYNSNLKPVGMLAQEYKQFGPLNELLSGLSAQAAEESGGISTTPFSHTAGKLNTTLSTLQSNPLVQQTINRISELDPSVKFSIEDVGRLSGDIQQSGAESAVRNFIRDKQNTQAVTSAEPWGVAGQNQTMSNSTYASYQDLLNQITPKANQSDWESMAARTSPGGNRQVSTLWRDPTSGKGVGVATNLNGLPAELVFYDSSGQSLNSSIFSPEGLYREAEKYGIDLSNIGQLGSMLDQKNISYKPGQLYAGTGSNAGIDFEDIARGGLGGKDDWTKPDPFMGVKFESGSLGEQTAIQQQNERQALAERLGITATSTAPAEIAGPPTPTAQQTAAAVVGTPFAANPVAQSAVPRNLMSLLPQDWGSITDPQKKIDWFNQQKATEAELLSAGVGQGDIDWMRQHGFGKYAHGGAVQMEDGGFVMTKRAVDGAGGPQGIQQLVPGARMIRGPGTGTSDSIPAVINGRNGKTPARLSNGEAYVPPGRNTKGLYALMHQLERKA